MYITIEEDRNWLSNALLDGTNDDQTQRDREIVMAVITTSTPTSIATYNISRHVHGNGDKVTEEP